MASFFDGFSEQEISALNSAYKEFLPTTETRREFRQEIDMILEEPVSEIPAGNIDEVLQRIALSEQFLNSLPREKSAKVPDILNALRIQKEQLEARRIEEKTKEEQQKKEAENPDQEKSTTEKLVDILVAAFGADFLVSTKATNADLGQLPRQLQNLASPRAGGKSPDLLKLV